MAEFPFLDLFHHLRDAGMPLTPEQYDLLRQALDQGYGLNGWEDLRRLCRLLWVKPCLSYDSDLFERTFDRYRQQLHRQWQSELEPSDPLPTKSQTPADAPTLPTVPPRRMPAQPAKNEGQAPVAVKTSPPQYDTAGDGSSEPGFHLMPTQMPVQLETIRGSWKVLRQLVQEGRDYELDLEGTIARINRDGVFSEVVLRPSLVQQAELLVLIDESEAMVPFHPVIQPLITSVEEQRISPAQLYRFTVFPDDFLYQWQYPTKAVPLVPLLSRLHRSRTVVWIVSDAGAAAGTYSPERLSGIVEFLTRLLPCIRELLWINPLPADRWQSTTAEAIAQALDGRMIALDPISLQRAVRQPFSLPILQ
jgi:uncharacterized protein